MKRIFFLLLLFCNLPLAGVAQPTLLVTELDQEFTDLSGHIVVFNDSRPHLQLSDVLKAHSSQFKPLAQFHTPKQKGSYWARLVIKSELDRDVLRSLRWFSLSSMRLNLLEAYVLKNNELQQQVLFGYARPRSQLQNTTEWDRFHLLLQKGGEYSLYFRIQNPYGFPPTFDICLVDPAQQLLRERQRHLINLLFEGMLWVLIVYNLVVYFHTRDRAYLYYSLYVFSSAAYTLYFSKYFLDLLLFEQPQLNAYFWLGSLGPGFVFYMLFVRHFLHTREFLPRSWNLAIGIALSTKAVLVLSFMVFYRFTGNVFSLTSAVSAVIPLETIFTIVLMVRLWKTRLKTVYYFIGSAAALWSGIFVSNALYAMGSENSLIFAQVTTVAELMIFSAGLGYRMRLIEEDKRKANNGLIEQLSVNEEIQARVSRDLELLVRQRTIEISSQQEEILAQNERLVETLEQLNHSYKQITDSIGYARRIQTALLPQPDEFGEKVRDYYIYYRPKNIVSGDFYWVKKMGNHLMVAAVDCTGHGVPGAFLSLLGVSFLNEISSKLQNEGQEIVASQVLDQLREKVKTSLKQNGHDNTAAKEAMDIGLCVFDFQQMQLQYAGAHNPLYLVRDGELSEYKGDKMPISWYLRERPFSNHLIQLVPNDVLYLFTDGMIDQFGGAIGDKLKANRFKSILRNFAHLPMAKQQVLLDHELKDWKNEHVQVDDILVLGVRI